MHKLIFATLLGCWFSVATASYQKDTTFLSYEEFAKLSRREILNRFGTDERAKRVIEDHYRNRRKGWPWIIPAAILNTGAVYCFSFSAGAANGMASVVSLTGGIVLLIPGLVALGIFLKKFVFRKKPPKEELYRRLKEYYRNR